MLFRIANKFDYKTVAKDTVWPSVITELQKHDLGQIPPCSL